ncbi:ATP-binding protein [Paenibacillus profundus]|uniref:ATP-binding protein n=1 Tax=Paenibacillus profundus TaxID=1173085 RepID=A0ABS8YJ58_9BACL|nr:ATP-binding protein [Paenibacillus profundus]MCE5171821.1 ATP-binding protein [Paenibacillus profundus]
MNYKNNHNSLIDFEFESNPPKLLKSLKSDNEEFYSGVLNVYKKTKDLLNIRVSQVFKDYTLHNVNHSLRIMYHIEKLIPDLDALSGLEKALLICSALLHDIGMSATEEEINKIKNNELEYKGLSYRVILKKYSGDHETAIQELLRIVHADRSYDYIMEKLKDDLTIPNMNVSYAEDVAIICKSHTKDRTWIENNVKEVGKKGSYDYNSKFCSILLRLGDILDFDVNRTPYKLYESLSLSGISKKEWEQHFVIHNFDKVINDPDSELKYIQFFGTSTNSLIHRKILIYFDWINDEIELANDITCAFEKRYKLNIYHNVKNNITSEGYSIADLRYTVNFKQVTNLLMGEQIYSDKKMGLREVIQNSIDACIVRKEIIERTANLWDDKFIAHISIIISEKDQEVKVIDNGIGMSLAVIKKYFLNVGVSYYRSDDYLMQDLKYQPIGNYGIGFLSCFMLSRIVKIKTRYYNDSNIYELELSKNDEYVSIKNLNEQFNFFGTEITFNFNEFMEVFGYEISSIKEFLEKCFLTDEILFTIINKDDRSQMYIENQLYNSEDASSNEIVIELSDYLYGVHGKVTLKKPSVIFKNNIDSLPYYGDSYFFDGNTLEPLDKNIYQLAHDGMIGIINIPLINDYYEFEKRNEVLDDVEAAVEDYIIKNSTDYLSIFSDYNLYLKATSGVIESGDEIFDGLDFDVLIEYGQDGDASTIVEKTTVYVFDSPKMDKYLILERVNSQRFLNLCELYIKNVLISSFDFKVDYFIKDLIAKPFRVNVDRKIIPNISRDNISKNDENIISSSIYQAICLGFLDYLRDHYVEKELLKNYIKKHHNYKSNFLREEYNCMLDEINI